MPEITVDGGTVGARPRRATIFNDDPEASERQPDAGMALFAEGLAEWPMARLEAVLTWESGAMTRAPFLRLGYGFFGLSR